MKKRVLIVLVLICAVMLTGITGAYAASESPADLHPVSSIAFLREWIEEINRMDEEAEQQGYHPVRKILIMEFTEEDEPYTPVRAITAEGSSIHSTVVMRIEEADNDESTGFSMTAVLLVNGKPADFRMDEKASTEGILTARMNSNRDYVISLSAENVPVLPGENEVILVMFGYSEDLDFYLDPQNIKGSFVSDQAYDGAAIIPCPEDEINVVAIRDRSGLQQYAEMRFISAEDMTDFQSDHYGNYLMTSKPDPVMYFYLDNMSIQGLTGSFSGIMFMLVDGELKPVWNGNCFGEISIQDSDLLKVIRVESGFRAGEQHHVYWYWQETGDIEEWPLSMAYRMKMKIE